MKTSALVYWIDKTFLLRTAEISSAQLKGGTTFEYEAGHITDGAEHMEVIMRACAGNVEERDRIERLKKKAKELQQLAGRPL